MRLLNVSLPVDLEAFIDDKVASGAFASSSDVALEALRLMRQQEDAERLVDLRHAWREGIDSADFQPLDREASKASARRRLATPD